MLCYDGQSRNGSVPTHFILLSSTVASSATHGYIVVPKRLSRNEEPAIEKKEQTKNVPSSYLILPQNLFSELLCILPVLEHKILSFLMHLFYFRHN